MKRIIVYADFDFLTNPEEIGTLGHETATELQIPIKLLESYSIRWDEQ